MIDQDKYNALREGDQIPTTADLIQAEVAAITAVLLEKNRKYGDSALCPARIFSSADPVEQLRVRIDDKLSRIRSSQGDDQEDTELDLLGYLVLLRCARRMEGLRRDAAARLAAGLAGGDFWGRAEPTTAAPRVDPVDGVDGVDGVDADESAADPESLARSLYVRPGVCAAPAEYWQALPEGSLGAQLHCRRQEARSKV